MKNVQNSRQPKFCWVLQRSGKVANLKGAIADSNGEGFTCALLDASQVKCWGYNGDGQLGDGTTKHMRNIPVKLSQLTDAIALALLRTMPVQYLTQARSKAGVIMVLGLWEMEPILIATFQPEFRNVLVQLPFSAEGTHTCALLHTSKVKLWGSNQQGELGDGTKKQSSNTPVKVMFR
jgi:alpha-tubulin suppressor-like RCC1 family protein